MLTLIAESKTMNSCSEQVSSSLFSANRPPLETEADAIMQSLQKMTPQQLSEAVKVSPALGQRLYMMIQEFPHKGTGCSAIKAFTGVVYKALDYSSLDNDAQSRLNEDVRIISSLYGFLRPQDIIKQFRFDFTTALAPGGKTFASFWRNNVTELVVDTIKSSKQSQVVNLLPGDAARCVDWKAVGNFAEVWKADFRQIQPGGLASTPNATLLKKLRGQLLRLVVSNNISNINDLSGLAGNDFYTQTIDPATKSIVFVTA